MQVMDQSLLVVGAGAAHLLELQDEELPASGMRAHRLAAPIQSDSVISKAMTVNFSAVTAGTLHCALW